MTNEALISADWADTKFRPVQNLAHVVLGPQHPDSGDAATDAIRQAF